MDYLRLLKEIINTPESTLQNQHNPPKQGFVSFVGSGSSTLEKIISEQEAATLASRLQLFAVKGIPSDEAESLANRLLVRDQHGDDRKACAECQHYLSGGGCTINVHPVGWSNLYTLHRCKGFGTASKDVPEMFRNGQIGQIGNHFKEQFT